MRALSAFDEGFLRARSPACGTSAMRTARQASSPAWRARRAILGRGRGCGGGAQRRQHHDRMTPERNKVIADLLKREAAEIGARLNPFDPALRAPAPAIRG